MCCVVQDCIKISHILIEHIELTAKLPDCCLWNNKSNINQFRLKNGNLLPLTFYLHQDCFQRTHTLSSPVFRYSNLLYSICTRYISLEFIGISCLVQNVVHEYHVVLDNMLHTNICCLNICVITVNRTFCAARYVVYDWISSDISNKILKHHNVIGK